MRNMNGGMIQIPILIDRSLNTTIKEQLVEGIRALIIKKIIKPKMRLPATRELSKQLSISRNSVKNAYCDLVDQGYLCSKKTSGTYVCEYLPKIDIGISHTCKEETSEGIFISDTQEPLNASVKHRMVEEDHYNFCLDRFDSNLMSTRTWRRILLKHLPYRERYANAQRYANEKNEAGLKNLRTAIANSVSPLRGMSVNTDNTFIISDNYRALDIIIQAVLKQGSRVAIEVPCDSGIKYLFDRFGIEVVPVPVDDSGIIVDAIPKLNIDLVYVSPSHQNPMGMTMSLQRREQLLAWASRSNAYIVECDTDGEFIYDESSFPSLYSLDNEQRVFYVNSFSAWIGAGVNMGYLVAPPVFVSKIKQVKKALHAEVSWLDQNVILEFISSKKYYSHLRRIKHTYKERRDTMVRSIKNNFGEQHLSGFEAGRHITWHLPMDFISVKKLQRQALSCGVSLSTLSENFYCSETYKAKYDYSRVVFLNYVAMNKKDIESGISCLKDACELKLNKVVTEQSKSLIYKSVGAS